MQGHRGLLLLGPPAALSGVCWPAGLGLGWASRALGGGAPPARVSRPPRARLRLCHEVAPGFGNTLTLWGIMSVWPTRRRGRSPIPQSPVVCGSPLRGLSCSRRVKRCDFAWYHGRPTDLSARIPANPQSPGDTAAQRTTARSQQQDNCRRSDSALPALGVRAVRHRCVRSLLPGTATDSG